MRLTSFTMLSALAGTALVSAQELGPWKRALARDPTNSMGFLGSNTNIGIIKYSSGTENNEHPFDKDMTKQGGCACDDRFAGVGCDKCDWTGTTDGNSDIDAWSGVDAQAGNMQGYGLQFGWLDGEATGRGTICDKYCDPFVTCSGNGVCNHGLKTDTAWAPIGVDPTFSSGNHPPGTCSCFPGFMGPSCGVCISDGKSDSDVVAVAPFKYKRTPYKAITKMMLHNELPAGLTQGNAQDIVLWNDGDQLNYNQDFGALYHGGVMRGCQQKPCEQADDACNGKGTCKAPLSMCGIKTSNMFDPALEQCCMFTAKADGFWADPDGDMGGLMVGPIPDKLGSGNGGNGDRGAFVKGGWMYHYTAKVDEICCGMGLKCKSTEMCYGDVGGVQHCATKQPAGECLGKEQKDTSFNIIGQARTLTNSSWMGYGHSSKMCKPEVEECCGGTCCDLSAGETCVELTKDWLAFSANPVGTVDQTWNAFMEWAPNYMGMDDETIKMEDSKKRQYMCSKETLTDTSAMRIIALPLFLIIAFIGGTVLVMLGRPGTGKGTLITTWVVVVLCIFLIFSIHWQSAVLLVFGAWVALLASGSGYKHAGSVATVVVVSIFFNVVIGSSGWMNHFVGSNSLFQVVGKDSDSASGLLNWSIGGGFTPGIFRTSGREFWGDVAARQHQCSAYFNYFAIDTGVPILGTYSDGATVGAAWPLVAWDHNMADVFYGFCDLNWMVAVELFKVFVTIAYVFLCASTAGGLWKNNNK